MAATGWYLAVLGYDCNRLAGISWVFEYKRLLTNLSQMCRRSWHAQVKNGYMLKMTMTSQPEGQASCAMGKGPVFKVVACRKAALSPKGDLSTKTHYFGGNASIPRWALTPGYSSCR